MPSDKRKAILKEISEIVSRLGLFEGDIDEEADFQRDLNLDSVMLFHLASEIEDHYDIFLQSSTFYEKKAPQKVGELVDVIMELLGEANEHESP